LASSPLPVGTPLGHINYAAAEYSHIDKPQLTTIRSISDIERLTFCPSSNEHGSRPARRDEGDFLSWLVNKRLNLAPARLNGIRINYLRLRMVAEPMKCKVFNNPGPRLAMIIQCLHFMPRHERTHILMFRLCSLAL
jgi:hypothetical protein